MSGGKLGLRSLHLAKQVFQVHGVDTAGAVVLRRRLRRSEVVRFFSMLPACLIGIEACATGLAGRRSPRSAATFLCAGHAQQPGGESPLCNLMEGKHE